MTFLRRLGLGVLTVVFLGSAAFSAWYVGNAAAPGTGPGRSTGSETVSAGTPSPTPAPSASPTPTATASATPTKAPAATPSKPPAKAPSKSPEPKPTPTLVPGPTILGPGDDGGDVRDLQARLKQIDWFAEDVTGYYGDVTASAVSGFQAKRGFPVTGEVDERTLDRLHEMTTTPTEDELFNKVPEVEAAGDLDERCLTGRVLCIDKSSQTLRWVVDGDVQTTVEVRFGSDELPTREGSFEVYRKSRDHVSSLYDTPMPYAMFFSGGQAVHYSPDFAANGYNGASHGCVNVRDYDTIAALYDQVQIGDDVVVYWS